MILIIGIISIGFIYILFLRPSGEPTPTPTPEGPEANTYAEESSIDYLKYSVKFTSGNIILENDITIFNGTINTYSFINSTDCLNCSINNETRLLTISLHNDVNVNLKNINYTDLAIYLHDNSSLIIENCTFYELWLFDLSSAIIKNSSIEYVRVSNPMEVPGVYNYQTSLSIIENSTVYSIGITEGCELFVKDSKLGGGWSIFIDTISPLIPVTANIENCTLKGVLARGYANLRFYGSNLTSLYVHDMARAVLDQSMVITNYGYGIVAYSGTTNIVEGKVTGTGYINNTRLINSVVPNPLVISVAANSSAVVKMNNFSCSVYLHDDSRATIANLTDSSLMFTHFSIFYGTLMDSSSLTMENNDLFPGYLTCLDNSKLILNHTTLSDLDCDSTNSITVNNCSISDIWTHSFDSNLAGDNIYIVNSTIFDLNVGGRDVVYVENCTISRLAEGVIVYSGSLILNSGGFSGTGNYKNSTTLVNTNILISRSLRNIEINGTAQVTIQDYSSQFDILCIDDSELICKNSTFENLIARDSANITVQNCSIYEQICLFDDSILNVTQIGYIDGVMAWGNSLASITNASIYLVYAYESSRISIYNSNVLSIYVLGSNTIDYALKVYDSMITYLSTFSW